ncbi:DnaJ domain-containing protein [Cercophora scortea]|uniref:DnaJ domain-containing protein n=1 Tax=Cercophora scortea TaxID=314031 RepID=A0AAE0J3E4_9PEZI|nr:DnaJ domain-containing protein [Cercophora scortea]
MSTRPPNYYAILEVSETATTTQIRDAYKRAALKTHPDRVPTDSPDRAARTRKFQLVNDAYYTLSDASRRREYDAQRKLFTPPSGGRGGGSKSETPGGFASDPFAEANASDNAAPGAGAGGGGGSAYSWAWNFFTGQGGNAQQQQREQTENEQFADVFEEMLREEGMADPATGRPTGKFWSVMGGLSGGALGFIVANVPGLLAGAVAGNRLGAVRDAKGKSVYAVFQVSALGVVMLPPWEESD